MKTIGLAVLASFLALSGLAIASQSDEQKGHSPMMQEIMKGRKQGEHKDGMMRMMKMMEQCAAMMESAHVDGNGVKENQK